MTAEDPKVLPRSASWEVDVVEMPDLLIEGADVEGVLLVVDSANGTVRDAGPVERGESLTPALLRAAWDPAAPLRPARPRALRCRKALVPRLQEAAAALGARVKPQSRLRTLDEAAASLLASIVGGLPRDARRWSPLVGRLIDAELWTVVPESVQLRFPTADPPLREAVALVLGQGGEQRGVVVFPCADDLEAFHALVDAGFPDSSASFTCWCAHLDPLAEFPERVLGLLRSGGLVGRGLGLRVFALEGLASRELTHQEEAALGTALEGVLGLWDACGAPLAWEPQAAAVETSMGPLDVVARPTDAADGREPLILNVDHQIALVRGHVQGRDQPLLILKMAKADARRMTQRVSGLDAISLRSLGDRLLQVVGWAGSAELGVLAELSDARMAWASWRKERSGSVAISGGGSKRAGFRAKEFVSVHPVELLRLEDEEDDVLFGEWGPDPKAWPKASEVLITFGELEELVDDDPAHLTGAAEYAAGVWNAVVVADELGEGGPLAEMMAALRGDPWSTGMLQSLVARKREFFGQDRRLFAVDFCERRFGHVAVRVSWTLPKQP